MNFRLAMTVLLCFVLLAGIHLFILTRNIALKYEVTDLKVRLGEVRSANRRLGGEVARQENLGFVEEYATGKLKMVYPEQVTYIVGARLVTPKPSLPPAPSAATD